MRKSLGEGNPVLEEENKLYFSLRYSQDAHLEHLGGSGDMSLRLKGEVRAREKKPRVVDN